MPTVGKRNALTDVKGIRVGHYTDLKALCGVTVVLCESGAVAGVDVRGSAPGTRETDLLNPVNLVESVQAVVLSGGSVFGLSAADGVVDWLEKRSVGFPLEEDHVAPIVPAAVLYDLGRGETFRPPIRAEWGRQACEKAGAGRVESGNVGAGTGAVSGGLKGGLGTASLVLENGLTMAALVAVNSLGTVIDPATGRPWEIRLEKEREFGHQGRRSVKLPPPPGGSPGKNTTIGVVATDGKLSKAQAGKLAQMAQDGLARAIRPAHTLFDGDTLFCLAVGQKDLPETPGFFVSPHAQAVNELGEAAADCVSRAIIHAILATRSLAGLTAFSDLENR